MKDVTERLRKIRQGKHLDIEYPSIRIQYKIIGFPEGLINTNNPTSRPERTVSIDEPIDTKIQFNAHNGVLTTLDMDFNEWFNWFFLNKSFIGSVYISYSATLIITYQSGLIVKQSLDDKYLFAAVFQYTSTQTGFSGAINADNLSNDGMWISNLPKLSGSWSDISSFTCNVSDILINDGTWSFDPFKKQLNSQVPQLTLYQTNNVDYIIQLVRYWWRDGYILPDAHWLHKIINKHNVKPEVDETYSPIFRSNNDALDSNGSNNSADLEPDILKDPIEWAEESANSISEQNKSGDYGDNANEQDIADAETLLNLLDKQLDASPVIEDIDVKDWAGTSLQERSERSNPQKYDSKQRLSAPVNISDSDPDSIAFGIQPYGAPYGKIFYPITIGTELSATDRWRLRLHTPGVKGSEKIVITGIEYNGVKYGEWNWHELPLIMTGSCKLYYRVD